MDDNVKFLAGMAAFHNTTMSDEQKRFVQQIERGDSPLLVEADGGIGKTLGYLVYGLRQAQIKNLPFVIATSTITNRDQIETEHKRIIAYAESIGDPIAKLPILNYRSARDYVSPARLAEMIKWVEKTNVSSAVLDELYAIQDQACDPDALLERVMPYDVVDDDGKVIVARSQIAARGSSEIAKKGDDDQPTEFAETRQAIKEYTSATTEDRACAIMMTHAMLAGSTQFKKMIMAGEIALVVIDEADKLTSMDFITYASLTMADPGRSRKNAATLENVLIRAEDADVDTNAVNEVFDHLQTLIADIKTTVSTEDKKNIILIYDRIGEKRTKMARTLVGDLSEALRDLAIRIADLPVKPDKDGEIATRLLLNDTEDLLDATDQLSEALNPESWTMNMTDTRVFLSWDEGDELRVVSARPGGVLEWLYRANATVPVVMTTAFIGEKEEWFAQKIKLPVRRLKKTHPIRVPPGGYGTLKFVYFRGLHDPIFDKKPNPAHYDDIVQSIRHYWEPGKRMVVLMPGYDDIKELDERLIGANPPIFAVLPPSAPLFPQLRGTNINEIRDRLVRSEEGGILLTVYWEGYNIVGDRPDRRGLIDVLVMSRIPFQQPNLMLQNLHEHFGWNEGLVFRDLKTEAKRRIHQGFNRVIRGPMDKGRVLILDKRFPAPKVLTNIHDDMPRLPRYVSLLDAIPDRFRGDATCFEYVDFETMERITDD